MATVTDLHHLQDWTSAVFWIAVALVVGSALLTRLLDWLAERDSRRIKVQIDQQAERRHLQRVMASRETSR